MKIEIHFCRRRSNINELVLLATPTGSSHWWPTTAAKCLKVIVLLFINNRDHVVRKVCWKIIVQQLINSDSFAIPWKYIWKHVLKISDVHLCISHVLEKCWKSSWAFKICLIFSNKLCLNVQIVFIKISAVSEECWNFSWAFKICLIL